MRQTLAAGGSHNGTGWRITKTSLSTEFEMGIGKSKLIACTVLMLGLAGLAQAQQSSSKMSGTTQEGAGSGNAMTGGAEGTTTDKGTPGAMRSGSESSGTSSGTSSGSSGAGNTMTGGAEARPTDQATPGQSAMPSSNAPGGSRSSMPQPGR
jgi:hypothetical protein